jgi:hypothetical protein
MSGTRAGALKGWRTRRRNERLIVNHYKKIAANEHTKDARAYDEYVRRSELRGEMTAAEVDNYRYENQRRYERLMRGTKPTKPRRKRGR